MDLKKILFSIIILFAGVHVGYGQSSAQLKKQLEKINAEIMNLNKELASKTRQKMLSQKEVNALSKQLNLRESKIDVINSELRVINNQISKNTAEINKLKAELEKMRNDYEKMIMFAFRNKNSYNKIMFIFASKDFNQAFKRVKYLQQFTDARKIKVSEIEAVQKDIELKNAQLDQDRQRQNVLLKEQQAERNIIAKDRAEHAAELNKYAKEERSVKQQLSKKQQEERRLQNELKAAIKAEIARAEREEAERRRRVAEAEAKRTGSTVAEAEKKMEPKKTGSAVLNNTPEAAKLSAGFQSNRGRLPWPVSQGNVVRGFGRAVVENGVVVDNDNIRIQTNDSAPVKAIFEGTVHAVLTVGTTAVLVKHGEYFTMYSHLKSVSVAKGQKVSTGTVIGTAASDSDLGYSYMDLGIYQGQSEQNPSAWIAR